MPLNGPGAAFALAATPDGVAIGYGQGVLLPGPRLLSAFHGLPGNQAMALALGPELYVGTPSGLGAVEGHRVRWRVGAGEGRLPHPWVTALALSRGALYVGTYGGGLVRRTATEAGRPGRFEPFVETEGLKISPGALVEAAGRLWFGTDGGGLYRSSLERDRFERVVVGLPSNHVTALEATPGALYVGTSDGLARVPLTETTEGASE
jgi:ligand-binding sensor domain-containing protein